MTKVIAFPRRAHHVPAPSDEALHRAFCDARAAMVHALRAWLATNPPPDDTSLEIDGTIGQLRGLHLLRDVGNGT